MGYTKDTFDSAKAELAKRKSEAEHRAYIIKENFLNLHPEGRLLLEKISSAGSKAAIAVVNGGDVRSELERLKAENLRYQREFDDLLAKNGLSREDIKAAYTCKKCQDTGYVDGYMCTCFKDLLKATAFNALNRVSPLQISSFDSFSTDYYASLPDGQRKMMTTNFEFCRDYAEKFSLSSQSILFQGGTGLGKTHLSLAIAGKAIDKGYGVVYGSVHSFASALERERFNPAEEDTAQLLNSADLLLLDDLGTEFPSQYVSSSLYNIIDTRIMKSLPTIISTNLSIEELQKRYGERLVSRLFSCYVRLTFAGKDIRILKKRMSQNNQ